MIYYSWYYWLMWVWNLNMHAYFDYITEIIACGISNGVDSKYSNQDWVDTTLNPVIAESFAPIWEWVDPICGLRHLVGPSRWMVYRIFRLLDYLGHRYWIHHHQRHPHLRYGMVRTSNGWCQMSRRSKFLFLW